MNAIKLYYQYLSFYGLVKRIIKPSSDKRKAIVTLKVENLKNLLPITKSDEKMIK